MRPFVVGVQWEGSEYFEIFQSCRDVFIASLGSRYMRCFPRPQNWELTLRTTASTGQSIPEQGIQEIAQLGNLHYTIEHRPEEPGRNFYVRLSQNDQTILYGMYWLILLDRLWLYYQGDFLSMIRKSHRDDWDYAVDKRNSVRLWKEFMNAQTVSTTDLLSLRSGPINYRRNMQWSTN